MHLKSLAAAIAFSLIAGSASAQLPSTTVVKPGRHIDPVWNGVLIGAGTGAVGAWIFTRANCGPRGYDDECSVNVGIVATPVFVASGMLVGGIIDRLINKTLPAGATSRTSISPLTTSKSGRKDTGVALKVKIQF